jgi:DNA-binding CsgD family transcriptional regulator
MPSAASRRLAEGRPPSHCGFLRRFCEHWHRQIASELSLGGLLEWIVEAATLMTGSQLGHTNQEIAVQLYISVRTAESHRAHIMQKLRLSTRAELVRYALSHGLLGDDAS